jgi:hypothetical protein
LFFYVDDIVMAFNLMNSGLHAEFEAKLFKKYQVKSMGNLTWFLGVRVVRDTTISKIWLIQDAYIDKVADRFKIRQTSKIPDLPLTENSLAPLTEE